MNDNVMHEWLVATIKKDMSLPLSEHEHKVMMAVDFSKRILDKSKPKHAEILQHLYFLDEWHSSKETAEQYATTQGRVNCIKRAFLAEINQNLNQTKGDEKP